MHSFTRQVDPDAVDRVLAYARKRLLMDPVPLDGPRTREELDAAVGATITPDGLGAARALEVFEHTLAQACLSTDHPRYLSFIPCAPTAEAAAFDVVVGASSVYGGSWLEGSGAVWAENQTLRWIADLAGMPPGTGGAFVPGGTVGNLSALVAARHTARRRATVEGTGARPFRIAATDNAHSSVVSMAAVMDAEVAAVEVDERLRMTGPALRRTLEDHGPETFFAVVATAGTTNFGVVDDLAGVADVCRELGVWLHVDGAYGGAGLAAPSVRPLFEGIERADSFIVDPHKWLFAPFDCCALLYRAPELARAAHTQQAGYLDVLTGGSDWNPADYSIGLTRRVRGLPLWFSLAVHGTDAYVEAIEDTLGVARFAAEEIGRRGHLEVVRDPDLSVVVFRRLGWGPADYQAWSDRLLREEHAFVCPTTFRGEVLTRFAVVNPRTTRDDVVAVLDTMGE
ncbi:MAG TPA: pyridoxal-dependent decarboxylase [Intrasporangium sp.]|uniref:pyridoxal phosphate-dependent decarboxylase family protein n=1 Tax=Intrasporangium sp. TaxID=1925024 RepID=UPI002D7748E7|nr:pyridoxal-dependent decarboxylase [Intrasporangium sp.]HET7399962.1 pyridoxal-dependent decarboxylase [Intrasporangium sp.]